MDETKNESMEKFFSICKLISDYIFKISLNNKKLMKIEWITGELTRETGYTVSDMNLSKKRNKIIFNDDKVKFKKFLYSVIAGQSNSAEIRFITKQGELRWFTIWGMPEWDKKKTVVVGIIGAAKDISERKKTENNLKDAIEELKAFSYAVSHDLRSPLRNAEGFSKALFEDYMDKLDGQGQHYIRRIRAAVRQMEDLINDLLKLSQITCKELKFKSVDMSMIAEDISRQIQRSQPERQSDFIIQKKMTVNGDPELLRIALYNLLENAWKFTAKKAKAKIEFGMTCYKNSPVFFMEDNGAGFDMAYADKLFVPFQRLHTSSEFPGTGIGLATVQQIFHRHGGRIWAESEAGKGAKVYFIV